MNDYNNIAKEIAEGTAREKLRARSVLEHGTRSDLPLVYRYVVLDVVSDPQAIDKVKIDYWEHDLNVSNIQHAHVAPRNSIIARRVQSNNTTVSEQTMILYPFLPPTISMPCNPGEHVWVMFEDPTGTRNDLGYWMWRIVGPEYVEDVNHTHPHRAHDPSFTPGTKDSFDGNTNAKYEFRNGSVGEIDGERYTIAETASLPEDGEDAYKRILTDSDGARLSHLEKVPRYRKRPGDVVFEGTNNSMIVLGRDRNGVVADYIADPKRGQVPSIPQTDVKGDGAGIIDIVAGRGQSTPTGGQTVVNDLQRNELAKEKTKVVPGEGDPDLRNDRSRVLVAQRTRIDTNMQLSEFNAEKFSMSEQENGDGAAAIKSDRIRFIARADLQLIVKGSERDENGNLVDDDDTSKWASIVIKANGDIVIMPSERGVIRLGGEDADKAIVCTDLPAINTNGQISSPAPLLTTMGGQIVTGTPGQGAVATRILVK